MAFIGLLIVLALNRSYHLTSQHIAKNRLILEFCEALLLDPSPVELIVLLDNLFDFNGIIHNSKFSLIIHSSCSLTILSGSHPNDGCTLPIIGGTDIYLYICLRQTSLLENKTPENIL